MATALDTAPPSAGEDSTKIEHTNVDSGPGAQTVASPLTEQYDDDFGDFEEAEWQEAGPNLALAEVGPTDTSTVSFWHVAEDGHVAATAPLDPLQLPPDEFRRLVTDALSRFGPFMRGAQNTESIPTLHDLEAQCPELRLSIPPVSKPAAHLHGAQQRMMQRLGIHDLRVATNQSKGKHPPSSRGTAQFTSASYTANGGLGDTSAALAADLDALAALTLSTHGPVGNVPRMTSDSLERQTEGHEVGEPLGRFGSSRCDESMTVVLQAERGLLRNREHDENGGCHPDDSIDIDEAR